MQIMLTWNIVIMGSLQESNGMLFDFFSALGLTIYKNLRACISICVLVILVCVVVFTMVLRRSYNDDINRYSACVRKIVVLKSEFDKMLANSKPLNMSNPEFETLIQYMDTFVSNGVCAQFELEYSDNEYTIIAMPNSAHKHNNCNIVLTPENSRFFDESKRSDYGYKYYNSYCGRFGRIE